MGRATEWNISHFLSKLNKDETSNRKQWQHFNYFTLRDQARWDDMGFKVYAARLNSNSLFLRFAFFTVTVWRLSRLSQASGVVCLLAHSREVFISWMVCKLRWNNRQGGGGTDLQIVNSTLILSPNCRASLYFQDRQTVIQQRCFQLDDHRPPGL